MTSRLLIVGLDNPQSRDPRFALYPAPAGCAGARLLGMIQEVDKTFTTHQYQRIPKTNLFPIGPSSGYKVIVLDAGRVLADQIIKTGWSAILLGTVVRDAVCPELMKTKWRQCRWVDMIGTRRARVAWIPHPSGRNHHYNDKKNRRQVGRFILEALR